ncbi:HNH endonuclease [Niallia sp. FSL R7-0271]|uniref:HNH endonuclease n=1 Tax=Niallia sp. FSL R7-0271 TaxID=2921678 RepID=UPI0030FC88AA
MGFSKEVIVSALTACKRHCCICERSVKTKIELHHIKQKSKGGKDSFDNCIPLCFDCHAEVGSYNNEHPKGNKYSEKELKKIRDDFYQKIDNGFMNIDTLNDSDNEKFQIFKEDVIDIIEGIIDTDFAAQPFSLELTNELSLIVEKWKKRKNSFDNKIIENIKNDIVHQLQCLSRYFILNDYFHLISGDRLIFNNYPLEKLEELRSDTLDIRRSLNNLLEKIDMY